MRLDSAAHDAAYAKAASPALRQMLRLPANEKSVRAPPLHARRDSLHAVALENLLAGGAQPGSVLLQTLLDGVIVTHLLAAKAGCIARTGLLLLRGACMALRKA